MNNLVVYTAFTRGYDNLMAPPKLWRDEANCVAFTDDTDLPAGWEIRPIHSGFSDPCRNAKIHKILPHIYFPEATYSLWMDANIETISDIGINNLIVTHLQQHDLAVFRHRHRQCAYVEAFQCMNLRKDSREVIRNQMAKYCLEGFPAGYGLAECSILLRRHTEKIQIFNEMWYKEIMEHSRRDQLSFNYVTRKLNLEFCYMPGTFNSNPYFTRKSHRQAWKTKNNT